VVVVVVVVCWCFWNEYIYRYHLVWPKSPFST
jgi:hypothetical protein